jgi:hypothetical protein
MSDVFIVGVNFSYSIDWGRMPLKFPQMDFTGVTGIMDVELTDENRAIVSTIAP